MTGGTWAAAASRAWRVRIWLMYEILRGALIGDGRDVAFVDLVQRAAAGRR